MGEVSATGFAALAGDLPLLIRVHARKPAAALFILDLYVIEVICVLHRVILLRIKRTELQYA